MLFDLVLCKVYMNVGDIYEEFNLINVSGNGWMLDMVDYICGSVVKEIKNGGILRNWIFVLGDVVDLQFVYVGVFNVVLFYGVIFIGLSDYLLFVIKVVVVGRVLVVYVVVNDGMLYGFNVVIGVEIYVYMFGVVVLVFINLFMFVQVSYGLGVNLYQYFNDGELMVVDVYFLNVWYMVFVGIMGCGLVKFIYVFDVMDFVDVKFLWEYLVKDNNDIGQVVGKFIVVQISVGWVVLVGNGYNSINGIVVLLSFLFDGFKLIIFVMDSISSNGFVIFGVWIDNMLNYVLIKVFVGDFVGYLWEFDFGFKGDVGMLVFLIQNF